MEGEQIADDLRSPGSESIVVRRPVYTLKKFEEEFSVDQGVNTPKKLPISKKLKCFFRNHFNPLGYLAIFNLFAEYKFKDYLISDFLSGLTGKLFTFILAIVVQFYNFKTSQILYKGGTERQKRTNFVRLTEYSACKYNYHQAGDL